MSNDQCLIRSPKRRRGVYARSGFSLAELMVSIGIFGIGMLMVAATFPVGLDQSRIVSEESIAPIIMNEAFATLRLLLNDPTQRITVPSGVVLSLSQAVRRHYADPSPGILVANSLIDPVAKPPDNFVSINDWLAAPYPGAQTCYYPSLAGQVLSSESPYSWSVLFRQPHWDADSVQFFVFVNRRSDRVPEFFQFGAANYDIDDPRIVYLPGGTKGMSGHLFEDGSLLLRENGDILKVKAVEGTAGDPYLALVENPLLKFASGNPLINPLDPVFWQVFPDPATGRSPVIAMSSRTYSLD